MMSYSEYGSEGVVCWVHDGDASVDEHVSGNVEVGREVLLNVPFFSGLLKRS